MKKSEVDSMNFTLKKKISIIAINRTVLPILDDLSFLQFIISDVVVFEFCIGKDGY